MGKANPTDAEIAELFEFRPLREPDKGARKRIDALRAKLADVARFVRETIPDPRQAQRTYNRLEDAFHDYCMDLTFDPTTTLAVVAEEPEATTGSPAAVVEAEERFGDAPAPGGEGPPPAAPAA